MINRIRLAHLRRTIPRIDVKIGGKIRPASKASWMRDLAFAVRPFSKVMGQTAPGRWRDYSASQTDDVFLARTVDSYVPCVRGRFASILIADLESEGVWVCLSTLRERRYCSQT